MKSRLIKRNATPGNLASVLIAAVLVAVAAFATQSRALAAPGDELLTAGINYHQNGDYNNAIRTLESFVAQYPTSQSRNKGELYLGAAYLARNGSTTDVTTARQHFNYILTQGKNAGSYRDAFFHNARSYYNAQDYANARTLLLQFLADFPNDSFNQYVYYYLAVCETNVGTLDQAIAYYDQSERNFPNSPLKWYCKLDKATLLGRKGQYAQADQQFAAIAADTTAPADIVGQATSQRALLRLVQRDANGSIALLEEYIQRYKNDPSQLATVQDAYLYEAYAWFAQKDYQRALNLIDEIERIGGSLPPKAAGVKLKLYLALGQYEAAESLLARVKSSSFGLANPDAVTSYQAMIDIRKGNRDVVISNLDAMLQPRTSAANANAVEFNYFNTPRNHLDPIDFVEACGVLTVAYAGRYGLNRNQNDYAWQDAIYQATARYVDRLNDPAVAMVLKAIDARRTAVMTNPQQSQQPGFSVVAPQGMYSNVPAGGDGFTQPPQTQAPTGIQSLAPQQGGQPQAQPQTGQAPSLGGQNLTPNTYAAPNAQGQSNYTALAPQIPQGTNAPQSNQLVPNAANAQTSPVPGGAAVAQNLPTNAAAANTVNGVVPNANGVPAANNAGAPQNAQNVAQAPQTTQGQESTKLTQEEARAAIKSATDLYTNLDFERANEVLLETMMKSETFWDDCPAEAVRIALLRANALLELGNRSEAQMTFGDIIAHEPNSPEATVAYYYLGMLADEAGRGDDAIENLSRATSGRGDFPYADAALYRLGRNEYERGNVNAAAQTFYRLYREYPGSPYWSHGAWNLANIEAERGADVSAEKIVNEALARQPDSSIVDYLLFLKGEIALRAKDYDKAVVAFDMIVDQYPDSRWYSRAKNRIASIPARFLNAASSASSNAKAAATTTLPGRVVESYDAAPPPAPRPSSSAASRPFDYEDEYYDDQDRSARSSVRIPSPSELRERAARNLPGGETRESRSSTTAPRSESGATPRASSNSTPRSNDARTSGSSTRTPIPSSSPTTSTRSGSSTRSN